MEETLNLRKTHNISPNSKPDDMDITEVSYIFLSFEGNSEA